MPTDGGERCPSRPGGMQGAGNWVSMLLKNVNAQGLKFSPFPSEATCNRAGGRAWTAIGQQGHGIFRNGCFQARATCCGGWWRRQTTSCEWLAPACLMSGARPVFGRNHGDLRIYRLDGSVESQSGHRQVQPRMHTSVPAIWDERPGAGCTPTARRKGWSWPSGCRHRWRRNAAPGRVHGGRLQAGQLTPRERSLWARVASDEMSSSKLSLPRPNLAARRREPGKEGVQE